MGYKLPDIRSGLYIVATPIGTVSDISLRALDLISNGNVLVAEDKRNLLKLMKIHGIKLEERVLMSYHDHNGQEQRPKIINFLKKSKSVIFVTDAGTPLIADPGFKLVSEAITNGFYISAAPGASAVLTALTVSGLPTDKFFFGGFIPNKKEERKAFFEKYLKLPATLVFYESAARICKTLDDLSLLCDPERGIVVCRELTKKFENVQRGTLKNILEYFATSGKIKGEIVLLLSPWQPQVFQNEQVNDILIDVMSYMSIKDSVSFVSKHLNISKKIVYTKALSIKNEI